MVIGFVAGLIFALLLVCAVNAQIIRKRVKKKKEEAKANPEKKIQTTKVIVFSIMLTYYAAFLLAAWVVIWKDFYQIGALLTYVGSVSVFAVAFYCWKSKAENLEKIKKGNPELQGTLSDFSGMSSQ